MTNSRQKTIKVTRKMRTKAERKFFNSGDIADGIEFMALTDNLTEFIKGDEDRWYR